MPEPLMVVAIGGNALIRDKQHQSVPDQMAALEETSHNLTKLVAAGWRLAIGGKDKGDAGCRVTRGAFTRAIGLCAMCPSRWESSRIILSTRCAF